MPARLSETEPNEAIDVHTQPGFERTRAAGGEHVVLQGGGAIIRVAGTRVKTRIWLQIDKLTLCGRVGGGSSQPTR